MVNAGLWYSFINSVQENSLRLVLLNFIKYLGFEGFETAEPLRTSEDCITTEVRGFDDRRIFISVLKENDTVKGKYVITDAKCNILDTIMFKSEGFDWIEEDEK